MNFHRRIALVALLVLPLSALGQSLAGTVRNLTTGKPQARAEVVLLRMDQGMDEEARTQADAQGRFSFKLADAAVPHMVRVNHQDVNYFRQAPPGTESVEVEVYDAAARVEGIRGIVNVLRYQADASGLQVTEVYGIKNESSPPRTWMDKRTLQIYLPAGAQIDSALVAGPGGLPVNSSPVPMDDKGHYGFVFPIRPGETRFQLSYRLPYSGHLDFKPRLTLPVEHLVVMHPTSMQFTPAPGSAGFEQNMEDQGALIHVATTVAPGSEPAYRIAGTGTMPEIASSAGGSGGAASAAAEGQRQGPGGGLGPPSEGPNPLQGQMGWILGGFAVLLTFGAIMMMRRPRLAPAPGGGSAVAVPRPSAAGATAALPSAPTRSALLLDALKEELFALEVDRQQGRLSPEEYEKTKAALDLTLARALSRTKKAG
ncbi:MAG TPA: carboxypeptidase-like regulatory domain-containing protein [Terriglobales bacterium]|nr:carboxypeptidase-like regulatory domain-containing protein [Terriglobales bacterium]